MEHVRAEYENTWPAKEWIFQPAYAVPFYWWRGDWGFTDPNPNPNICILKWRTGCLCVE